MSSFIDALKNREAKMKPILQEILSEGFELQGWKYAHYSAYKKGDDMIFYDGVRDKIALRYNLKEKKDD